VINNRVPTFMGESPAIPLYQDLAGDTEVRRFPYRELEVALVGPFLLYSGPLEKYVSQNATVIVESLTPVLDTLGKAGAEILEAPNEVPNGTRIGCAVVQRVLAQILGSGRGG